MDRKTCAYCGCSLLSKNKNAKYCSLKCKNLYAKYVNAKKHPKNSLLMDDIKELEEYNKTHGTMLSYGKFKTMKYIESLKKKGR